MIDTNDTCSSKGITDERTLSLGSIRTELYPQKSVTLSQCFQVVRPSFPIPTHGILGKDFLWNNKCTIDAGENTLTMRNGSTKIVLSLQDDYDDEIWVPLVVK